LLSCPTIISPCLTPPSIADQYAANGYLTLVPDLFDGNTCPLNPPPEFDLMAWVKNELPKVETVDTKCESVIKYARGDLGVKRLGAVGYCFGGKYVCRWLKPGKIDVGFTAHPSFVDAEEVKGLQGPLSIAAAGTFYLSSSALSQALLICPFLETDQIFPAEKRRETEDILQKMDIPYQMNLFSDVSHGFAVRCDLSVKAQKFAKEQAFFQAVNWFDEYLKQ
jgi:dienelactone hydrolase